MKIQTALFATLMALVTSAGATTVIDSFNDVGGATNNIALAYLNNTGIGGIGFTTKYEQTGSYVAVLRTNDVTAPLVNYVSGQAGTTQHWSVGATTIGTAGVARRTQSRSTPSMSGTIWFSFLASLLTTNGDVALIFNGTFASGGQLSPTSQGMRVGLGHYANSSVRGAFGVGPLATGTAVADLSSIVNGVNGAVTAPWYVPSNGTGGLVLGRIDLDSGSGYPRVSVWYNPDVPNAASLPAPTLTFTDSTYSIVPTTVTRIGYQNVRSAAPLTANDLLDNVKVSDEPNGFDIVYKNAPLPIPIVSVTATVPQGSEDGPTNIVFTLTTDRPVTSDVAVQYVLSGVATNGYIPYSYPASYTNADYVDGNFNPDTQVSTVTIRSGASNASVTLQVVNDAIPEAIESVVFTIQAQPSLYLLGSSPSASGTILDNNDANTSVQYMFERNGLPQVWDTNISASTCALAQGFNFNSTAYNNSIFSILDYPSPSAALSAPGNWTPDNAADALTSGSYASVQVAPAPGRSMTLTNFEFMAIYGNYMNQVPTATGAVVFVRSSVDNFATDLGNFVLLPAESIFPATGWSTNRISLNTSFGNLLGQVEFRFYFFDDSNTNQVGVRIDNLFIGATTASAPVGSQQVYVTGSVTNAAEPATPGEFTVSRVGDVSSPLTVYYTVSGTASNGVDFVALPGSVTISAGQSNAVVAVMPIDDDTPEATETVILTVTPDTQYAVLPPASATVYLADDGDIGGLVAWFFNENNNNAASLAAVAAPTTKSQLTALNAAAGPGLGTFGANNTGGVGHGYGTGAYRSGPSSFYARCDFVGTNALTALTNGDYVSFTVSPGTAGGSLTLSNFTAWLALAPGSNQTAQAFLRSSLDQFASDIGSLSVTGATTTTSTAFMPWNVPLSVASYPGMIEFRLYFYSSRIAGGDIFRIDDVLLQGSVGSLPPGAQVVSVLASSPNASEPGTAGAFTLARAGNTSNPLTVSYTIGGTASNGVDYGLLSGTATFAATVSNLVLPVNVIDDNRPEPAETVILSLLGGSGYYCTLPNTATVTIADDGDTTPVFTFRAADTNAYERVPGLSGAFTVNRIAGDTTGTVNLDFTLGGTAVIGVDYLPTFTNTLTFGPGVLSQTVTITPIDNAIADGNRTVTMTLAGNSGVILDPPTSGTVTIIDDETPVATLLWSDNFDQGTSATNYSMTAGSESGAPDYAADFAFDYAAIGVPPAPHSAGTTIGLKLDANFLTQSAGVNCYVPGHSFSNNFALRFDLFLSIDATKNTDREVALFGINQSGTATNWMWAAPGVTTAYSYSGEGIWAAVATRDGAPGIGNLYSSAGPGVAPVLVGSRNQLNDLFNSPPYATGGCPNNAYDSTNKTWAECELSQVAGVVTLKLNNNVLLQYANDTPFTNGVIFLGFNDPWATLGSANCFAIFDNIRVIAVAEPVTQPLIRTISVAGSVVTVAFTGGATDQATAFKLESSSTVNGTYTDDNSAIFSGSAGSFQASTAVNGSTRFYKIRR